MKIKFEWEAIHHNTYRAKVFGGWIVTNESYTGTETSVYVPDQNHEWEIEK